MAPRANWKGFLKLSLVSRSIALFPATSTRERIRFNIINRKTGSRVRYQKIDTEAGEMVPQQDRVLIQAKQVGKPAPTTPPRPTNVINLMDALRRSVRSERGGGSGGSEAPSRRGGKVPAQRQSPATRERDGAKGIRLKRAS